MAKRVDPQSPWRGAPAALVTRFDAALRDLPGISRRMMFGYPVAVVDGNMFASLWQDRMVLRLSPADRAALLDLEGAAPFEPVSGRPWKEYVLAPATLVESPDDLRRWVERSCDYARALPPKPAKNRQA